MSAVRQGAFAAALLLCACDASTTPAPSPTRNKDDAPVVVPPEPPTTPVSASEILVPRAGAAGPAEYVGEDATLRLFGIETGDGTRPPVAVLADTTTWVTRAYAEGALLGRGARVERVTPESVELRLAGGGVLEVRPGADVHLRLVRHVDDRIVRPLGRHRYVFYPQASRAAPDARGTLADAEPVEVFGRTMYRMPPLPDGSLLAEAGLREGDLVADIGGLPAERRAPSAIRDALLAGSAFDVRVFRGGVPVRLRFVPPPP